MTARSKAHGKARSGDPQTSFEAALHATEPVKLRASQARVLNMFKLYGDMTDRQLLDYLNDMEKSAGLKPMSPSGARTRRSELSKPNMDRLDEIAVEISREKDRAVPVGMSMGEAKNRGLVYPGPVDFAALSFEHQKRARAQLRGEGFRSPLWDTGARAVVDGRNMIVWGLAV